MHAITRGSSTLGHSRHVHPDSLVAHLQIQKLADRSDVISEVPKCPKIQILRDVVTNHVVIVTDDLSPTP